VWVSPPQSSKKRTDCGYNTLVELCESNMSEPLTAEEQLMLDLMKYMASTEATPSKGCPPVISLDRVEAAFCAVLGALDKKYF